MRDDHPTWISLQLPDGRDWIEYMVVGTPDTKAFPPTWQLQTWVFLTTSPWAFLTRAPQTRRCWNGDRLQGQDQTPKIGRDAKWRLNLLDPDGTRAELMEFHAIGKPCCSPFRASDPER